MITRPTSLKEEFMLDTFSSGPRKKSKLDCHVNMDNPDLFGFFSLLLPDFVISSVYVCD